MNAYTFILTIIGLAAIVLLLINYFRAKNVATTEAQEEKVIDAETKNESLDQLVIDANNNSISATNGSLANGTARAIPGSANTPTDSR